MSDRSGPVVGVVGGGQLARMMHQSAISLAVDLEILAASASDPAVLAGASHRIGSATDAAALAGLAAAVDVVTFDHEVVDLDAARDLERSGCRLAPSAEALAVVADKAELRLRFERAGLPQPPFVVLAGDDLDRLGVAAAEWSSLVLKPARGGYDGRGVFMIDDLAAATDVVSPRLAAGERFVVEPRLPLDGELAVVVARRRSGDYVVYPPVTTIQRDGMCVEVDLPCDVDPSLATQARSLAVEVADELGVVGLCAVELFVVGGRLLVNELAVRPHNTAHLTMDACRTSQFENHIRAVLDLPLGSTDPVVPAAVMVNVVGGVDGVDPRDLLARALDLDDGARVHLYAKESRPGRKIGHVTVLDASVADARRRAWAVSAGLGSPTGAHV